MSSMKGSCGVHDLSAGAKIVLDGDETVPVIFILDKIFMGKVSRGALILQRPEVERLRDILDVWLSGQYDQAAFESFESAWAETLRKSSQEIAKTSNQAMAKAFALARFVSSKITPSLHDHFIVGDGYRDSMKDN